MQERRCFKRLHVGLPVTLRVAGCLVPATALNISCGGVYLDVENDEINLSDKGKVEVIIDLSQEERDVSLRGEITRIEVAGGQKVGIRFTNLYTVGHQILERFINKHLN